MNEITRKQKFDDNWRFYLGDLDPRTETDGWGGAKARAYSFGAVKFDLDDKKWRTVNLPHDFVMEGDYTKNKADNKEMTHIPEMESIDSRHFAGGSLAGGIAWYRKHFDVSSDMENKRIYLHFDGIYRNSTIYLNEYYVGSHKSGYTSFCLDITDFVNIGGENVLAVRVDSTGREGWWYEGGGIYRHVWLEDKAQIHIADNGVYVSSDIAEDMKSTTVNIETELANYLLEDSVITVKTVIFDKDDNQIETVENSIDLSPWTGNKCKQSIELKDFCLWSIENPYLYSIKTEIYLGDTLVDQQITSFGIRHTRFDADQGFFLNGRHLKIKGLCCHQDHAGVGIGVPDSVLEYRIAKMKEMGSNAYRCAHYPPSRELLDVCDRLGMLVFDETRRMSSAEDDLNALRSMIKRDRNHPSVFLWGIGNEEIFAQHRPEMARSTVTMKMEVQKLDETRPITSAVVCWNGKERFDTAEGYVDVTKHLDVMGFNYCKTAWDDYHNRMPKQPVIITEEATSNSTRGCYSTDERKGHYYLFDRENATKCKIAKKAVRAIENLGESNWKYCAEREYLAGMFLWTGIDYRGEPTPLTYPSVYSHFGILDYCGFPKDNFYYYKSWWTDEKVLHIFPHWNFPDMEGKPIDIMCYSNLDEVELFVNGKSYGKKSMEKNWYLTWENVIYEPGELKAVGYKDGKEMMSDLVKTTGSPSAIKLIPYKQTRSAKDDALIINVCVTDENGNVVPTADNEMTFEVSGPGEFLGAGNGNPGDHASDKIPVRRLFNGFAQLLVKPVGNGDIVVTVKSDGMKSATVKINI